MADINALLESYQPRSSRRQWPVPAANSTRRSAKDEIGGPAGQLRSEKIVSLAEAAP